MSGESKVLATGGTGFIGRRCLPLLVEAGFEVHAVTPDEAPIPDDVTWHRADLLSSEAAASLLDAVRPTHLLHLAWCAAHSDYWTSPENLRWLAAGLDLSRAFVACGGRRVVTAGTCAEYDWSSGTCVEDVTPLRPTTLYGACKCALHVASGEYFALEGVSAAWAHLFYLFGPGEHPSRLVSSAARSILEGRPFTCSHPDRVRDYLHVDDAARALVSLLTSQAVGDVNVASGRPVEIGAIVGAVASAAGRPDLARLEQAAEDSEPISLTADTSRLRDELGWVPSYDLARGIAQTVDWWRGEI